MASPQSLNKAKANLKQEMYDFDPDGTSASDVGWVDMRDYERILVCVMKSVGTGKISTFKLVGNPQSDGSGTDVDIASHSLSSDVDAVGDYVFLEASAEQLAQEGADNNEDLRYINAELALATSTDECVVTYTRLEPKFPQDGLSADSIA